MRGSFFLIKCEMTYKQAFEILERDLICEWLKHPVDRLLKFMRSWGNPNKNAEKFKQAYYFMTASKKREAVFKVWFFMKMLPKDE